MQPKLRTTAKERLIVALDVETPTQALDLVQELRGRVGMFKVGSQLFTTGGPNLVKQIVAAGDRVFLDLKFHDIPHQVSGATRAAAELGVSMLTIHAAGGSEMMKRAADAASEVAARENASRTRIVAVTILTSIDAKTLNEIGIPAEPTDAVRRLAALASSAGMDGVVVSPQEAAAVRAQINKQQFLIVTPGIRPAENEEFRDDQMRIATPAAALTAGADYLVVGRPITAAKDISAAAEAIVRQMEQTLGE